MKPNILFLVIDSFRSDKCYGNNKTSKTPNIDSLMKQGVYFSQMISPAPSSIPATASLLTALYPFKALLSDKNNHKLHPKSTTYISILNDNGYNTYATIPELFSLVELSRDFKNVTTLQFTDLALSNGLGQKIIDQLKSNSMKEPWIYYVHSMDLHETNLLPPEFNSNEYGHNKYERMVSALDVWIGKILQQINLNNTIVVLTADHASDADDYASDIKNFQKTSNAFQQGFIFKLLTKIVASFPNILEPLRTRIRETYNTVIEERTLSKIKHLNMPPHEKRVLLNAVNLVYQVYDEKFRIPLIFAGYGIHPRSTITQQVRNIDVFPTIEEIAGFSSKNKNVHGRSLLPLIQGKELEELPIYVESSGNRMRVYTTDEIGIRTSKYKYFRARKDPKKRVHLYDLQNDPLEENNIANIKPSIVGEMEKILTEITNDSQLNLKEKTIEDEITEEQIKKIEEELSKLGYKNLKRTLER